LTTPKSNGDKIQTHHFQTQSKNIGDKAKKVEMKPTATKPRKQTNAKPRVANPYTKKDTKAKVSFTKPKL
jgi:hypothetical protein